MKSLFIFAIFSVSALAADDTTIYETKVYDSSFSTSSKVVISKDEIQDSKAPNMSALLSTKANINITNSAFQPNSLLVRGGDASQILIIIDDIPVYDASTAQRAFNLNSINVNSVERITVVKGSQSVWYGGQALSAVIRIDTIPRSWKQSNRVDIQGGSSDYREISADVQQPLSDASLAILRGQYQFQNAQSPIEHSDFKYKRNKDNIDIVYVYQDDFQFNTKLSHYSDRNENVTGFSFMDFRALDTLGFVTTTEVNQIQMSFRNNSVSLRPLLSLGFVDTWRVFSHSVSIYKSSEENQEYKSYLIPVRGELRLINTPEWVWDMGLSFQKEGMLYEEFKVEQAKISNEMSGAFTKLEWRPQANVSVSTGYRYDTNLHYRDVGTYQISAKYNELSMEYSTGYRVPSLYQLFSNKGNTWLNPEFARTYTLSYEKVHDEQWETSTTLFETHVEGLIASRGNPMMYYNIGRTITKGIETAAVYRHTYDQKWTLNLAYQEPRDISTGKWLVRRPLKSGSLVYSKKDGPTTLNIEVVGRGERDDTKNARQTVRLPGYATLSASYIFELSKDTARSLASDEISLFFRGQNLTGDRYEESYGYLSPGMEFFAGLSIQL